MRGKKEMTGQGKKYELEQSNHFRIRGEGILSSFFDC